jgi:hypothetical protein
LTAVENLETTLRAVEPAVRLVSERHLLKVIDYLRDRDHPVPINPDLPLWVDRSVLVQAGVLPESVLAGAGDRLLLITDPPSRGLEHDPRGDQLRAYWRALFHGAVTNELDRRLAAGELDAHTCGLLLSRFGAPASREIRYVLETDHYADREADDAGRFREFAAVYLDLLYFSPPAVAAFFPTLPPVASVLRVLGEHLDVRSLFEMTRPEGAAEPDDPEPHTEGDEDDSSDGPAPPSAPEAGVPVASEAERTGNFVRAAILYTRAGATVEAQAALARLVSALAGVVGWDDHEQAQWQTGLAPLLGPAASGEWPRAARCLYELQKIPGDAGREVFAVDLVESIRTLGRRPVKRPLPHARVVILLMHLKAAHRQLLRSRVGVTDRETPTALLHHEIHRTESRIRSELGPIITASLEEAGLRPASRVESVAREKVVAELLDRVSERGVLRIGSLRDAIARNQLKMPDLAGPGEFFAGDPLLRADTRLAQDLDGVYRRGEFYLRLLQRFSSLFFGTHSGRLLFRFLVLPFVAAFMTVVFAQELTHLGEKGYRFGSRILAPRPAAAAEVPRPAPVPATAPDPDGEVEAKDVEFDPDTGEVVLLDTTEAIAVAKVVVGSSAAAPEHHEEFTVLWEWVGPLTILFLVLFHVPAARRVVVAVATGAWVFVWFVAWGVPLAVWRSPVVKSVRQSAVVRLIHHYLAGALVVTLAVVAVMAVLGAPWVRLLRWGGVVFGVTAVLANTGWGWVAQERLAARLDDGLRLFRVNLIPGFIGWVIGGFRWLANWIEARLYRVDEWLRFRGGDSSGSLAVKAILGLVWFPIAYVFRFAFYLLLEPQINPVKHFPVVTVSHKVLLPMFPTVAELFHVTPDTAFIMVGCVPGIFGFIAWELMANWRMYRANRPGRLRAVVVGSHGESVRGLLRPGFHSGTVPKLFRRLRKAERKGDRGGVGRVEHELEHAAEGVDLFVERELLPLLDGSPEWGGQRVSGVEVRFGCQRVVVELSAPDIGAEAFAFALENRDGTIEASIDRPGWSDGLTSDQRTAFVSAVRGLFDMSAAGLFEGKPRTPDAESELARPWTWDEWVCRWERKA